jgi:cysteinyl-tRNA synthetase
MSLRIYNTLSQRKEAFEPLVPGEVRMYACGPTVYDRAHLGHARAALTFDVISRYLEYRRYRVTYVRNFTDVDDKIIARAASLGRSWDALAEEEIEAYRQDMGALGLRTPTHEPRATRHIGEMIAMIERLIGRGMAYVVDGDVYFEVRRYADYGKLSHRSLEELRTGARVEVDPRKRDPLDFALWKVSKPGEPFWESPWGRGRPGWHIECSAMSMKYLGETFDIHGGGADLIFPHHENEIAQSECATGRPFARYWIHNGFININAEKMSKSLGNVFTLRELLTHVSADAVKLFLLGTHYRAPLEFSQEAIGQAARAEERFRTALAEIERLGQLRPSGDWASGGDAPLRKEIRRARQEFEDAMDDDFATPRALAALFRLLRDVNVALREAERGQDPALVEGLVLAGEALRGLGWVLGGLFQSRVGAVSYVEMSARSQVEEAEYLRARALILEARATGQALPKDAVDTVVEYRHQRRAARDWATADRIRDWLAEVGVMVDDTAMGARWHLKGAGT